MLGRSERRGGNREMVRKRTVEMVNNSDRLLSMSCERRGGDGCKEEEKRETEPKRDAAVPAARRRSQDDHTATLTPAFITLALSSDTVRFD